MAKLHAKARAALSASDFAYPKARAFPIEDRGHAEVALADARKKGPAVYAHVAAAVRKHFPGMTVVDHH